MSEDRNNPPTHGDMDDIRIAVICVEERIEEATQEAQEIKHILNLLLTIVARQAGLDDEDVADLAHGFIKLEAKA